jgi:large subunit ribosomal protein L3
MQKAVIGIKKGMTQVFDETGTVVPVTIIDMADVFLIDKQEKDSELLVKVGIGLKKKPNKPEQKKYEKIGKVPTRVLQFKLSDKSKYDSLNDGDQLLPSIFAVGDITQVTSKTKGKGFAGVVKRWGFAGGPRTHGQSDRERAPGAISGGTTIGRVHKGKKMGGHMGNKPKTIMNLRVIACDDDNKLLLLKGAVPGPKGAAVIVSESSLSSRFNKDQS